MTTSEFYHRAKTDPAFRQTQLDNLRYYKAVGTVLIWIVALLGAATTLYGGLSGHGWSGAFGAGSDLGVIALMRAWCIHRIARLEAFDRATE